jgi:hypothetical protein
MSSVLFFILLMGNILAQTDDDSNRYIISLSGNSTDPSDYVMNLDKFVGGVGVESIVKTAAINVDKNSQNVISVSSTNGDIGVDLGAIGSVEFQAQGISHDKFYFNYTLSKTKIYNSYMDGSFDPTVDDYQVGCQVVSNDVGVTITTAGNPNITNIVTYSYATFGLIPGDFGAYYLTLRDDIVQVQALSELIASSDVNGKQYMSTIQYSNMWLINQPYDTRIYLVLKDKFQNSLFFFSISLLAESIDDIKAGKRVSLAYYTDVSLNQTETYTINNIGIFKQDLLIGTNKGLYIFRKDSNVYSRYQFNKLIVDPKKVIVSNTNSNTNTTATTSTTTSSSTATSPTATSSTSPTTNPTATSSTSSTTSNTNTTPTSTSTSDATSTGSTTSGTGSTTPTSSTTTSGTSGSITPSTSSTTTTTGSTTTNTSVPSTSTGAADANNIPSSSSSATFDSKPITLAGFSVNELTVYAVFSGYGMIILDPNRDYEINDWYFRHPYLLSIDFINNPYLGNKYVGLAVKNLNQITEFFIELLVDNEFKPFLNKVYVSNEIIVVDNFLMTDLFYTYFFNKVNRQLIVIRRGLINAVPRETLVIPLDYYVTLGALYNNPMVSLYNSNTNKVVPAITFSNSFYIVKDILDAGTSIDCFFKKSGNYSIGYQLRTELCKPSISSEYIYSFCQKTVAFQYNVIGADTSDYDILVGVFVTVFGLIITGIVAWLLRKTQCCTNFKAFKIKKQQNINREDLYLDHEPEKVTKRAPINEPLVVPKMEEKVDPNEPEDYLALGKGTKSTGFGYDLKDADNKLVVSTNSQMMRVSTKKFKKQEIVFFTPEVENIQVSKTNHFYENNQHQPIHILDDEINIKSPPRVVNTDAVDSDKLVRGTYDYDAIDIKGVENNLKDMDEATTAKRRTKIKRKNRDMMKDSGLEEFKEHKEEKKDDSFEY